MHGIPASGTGLSGTGPTTHGVFSYIRRLRDCTALVVRRTRLPWPFATRPSFPEAGYRGWTTILRISAVCEIVPPWWCGEPVCHGLSQHARRSQRLGTGVGRRFFAYPPSARLYRPGGAANPFAMAFRNTPVVPRGWVPGLDDDSSHIRRLRDCTALAVRRTRLRWPFATRPVVPRGRVSGLDKREVHIEITCRQDVLCGESFASTPLAGVLDPFELDGDICAVQRADAALKKGQFPDVGSLIEGWISASGPGCLTTSLNNRARSRVWATSEVRRAVDAESGKEGRISLEDFCS